VTNTLATPEMVSTWVSLHCFCSVFLLWWMSRVSPDLSVEASPDSMATLSRRGKRTCQRTACQVLVWRRAPWAAMVEKSVWPADFLVAGLGSRQSSPSLEKRHIHSLSNTDICL